MQRLMLAASQRRRSAPTRGRQVGSYYYTQIATKAHELAPREQTANRTSNTPRLGSAALAASARELASNPPYSQPATGR